MVAEALARVRAGQHLAARTRPVRRAYRGLAAEGAGQIVSVHLSGEMSGTFESAQLAALEVEVRVTCVDSRQVGVATGYAALSAADGATPAALARRRRRGPPACGRAHVLFYVDTLEYLRRGGRVGAAAALLGGALAVKPLLQIDHGTVASLEKVRTSTKALARLADLAVTAAGDDAVDVCGSAPGQPRRADQLADVLARPVAENLGGRDGGAASSAPCSAPTWARA